MRKLYLVLLFIQQFSFVFAQQRPSPVDNISGNNTFNTFQLHSGFDQTDLFGNLYVFSTPDSSITVERIVAKSPNFKQIDRAIPDLGSDHRYHWVKFQVSNLTEKPQELVSYLHSNELDDVNFYVVNDNNRVVYFQEHFDHETFIRDKPIHSDYFAFPVSINPHQNLSLYWRVKRDHGPLVFPLRLYSKESFFNFNIVYNFLAYLSYGVLAITFLLSGILFFVTKHKLLYYYAGYCLFYLLLCFSNEGVLNQYFHLNIPLIGDNARILISGILLYYIMLFSVNFLQISSYTPKWFLKFTTSLSYLALLFVLGSLILPYVSVLSAILSIMILFYLLVVFGMILYGMINKKREAFIYFIAIFLFFSNSIWLTLIAIFHVKATWFYYQTILYQTIIEFVILGLELGYGIISDRNSYLQRLNILQQQFTTSILGAQDSERERIASDLHDDLGGTIATIRRKVSDMKLRLTNQEIIKEFDDLEPLILKSGEDLRRISHNLMPPEFVRIGLLSSLKQLVQSIPEIPTRFEFLTAGSERKIETNIELNAYRIVSELIQNILKHAKAKHATVQILFFLDQLRIIVEDDGIGDLQLQSDKLTSGMGIKNCILRADYIGAKLVREVSPAGTFVVLDIPYSSTSHEPSVTDQNIIG